MFKDTKVFKKSFHTISCAQVFNPPGIDFFLSFFFFFAWCEVGNSTSFFSPIRTANRSSALEKHPLWNSPPPPQGPAAPPVGCIRFSYTCGSISPASVPVLWPICPSSGYCHMVSLYLVKPLELPPLNWKGQWLPESRSHRIHFCTLVLTYYVDIHVMLLFTKTFSNCLLGS